MTVLYIAVDESGLPSQGDCYVVVGCWYVSERHDPTSPLADLKDDLLRFVGTKQRGGTPDELKGGKMKPGTINGVVDRIESWMWQLDTVETANLPWDSSYPLGFSRVAYHAEAARRTIERTGVASLEAPNTLKEIALNSILTPLYYEHQLQTRHVDDSCVVLDGNPWVRPADRLGEHWGDEIDTEPPEFQIRDSKETPGIQIADVAALVWKKHSKNDVCSRSAATLSNYAVPR